MTHSGAPPLTAIPVEALPYRELFEVHPHPTWLFDRETLRILAVNRAAVRQYGYTREEFREMTIEALWSEEDASRLRGYLADLPHGMEDTDLQRHRTRGGRVFPVRVASHDVKIGDRWAQLVQAQEITDELEEHEELATRLARAREAREAEEEEREALRESEERFRLVSRATTDVIWDWDARTDRLWWNEGVRTAFGLEPGASTHDSSAWAARVHPDDRVRVLADIRDVIKGSADSYEAEYRFRRNDGSYAHVRDRGLVFRDDEGRTVRIIGGMTDITPQRELGDRLLQAQRMQSIGNLAGGIAHDLNNVLTPILMSMNLLEHHVDSEDGMETLASIQLGAERAAALVEQVLAFARGLENPRGPVDMAHLVEELRKVLRETFPPCIELEVDLPPELPTIQGDPSQIHQVLLNLCLNARDAMPGGGRLRIGVEEVRVEPGRVGTHAPGGDGHHLRVEVEDTGSGMPRGVVDQIFDPFFTTKDAGRGRGLGLSIVATIMRGHGGSITVDSRPGRGTRFDLCFPVAAPGEWEVPAEARPMQDAPEPEPRRDWILVVDDEPAVRSVARRTLATLGYRVRSAPEGESALETLAEMGHGRVAAVVTDLMMPGMDGSALIATLLERFPHLPIVATSGLEPDARTSEAIESGRVVFLPKPYTTDELTAALREAARSRS